MTINFKLSILYKSIPLIPMAMRPVASLLLNSLGFVHLWICALVITCELKHVIALNELLKLAVSQWNDRKWVIPDVIFQAQVWRCRWSGHHQRFPASPSDTSWEPKITSSQRLPLHEIQHSSGAAVLSDSSTKTDSHQLLTLILFQTGFNFIQCTFPWRTQLIKDVKCPWGIKATIATSFAIIQKLFLSIKCFL